MKPVIIYNTKYGATKQYARWLADALQSPAYTPDEVENKLDDFSCLLIGSPVYFGKLLISGWLQRNLRWLQQKKIFLFVVCNTPENEPENRQRILDNSIPGLLAGRVTTVFLPGRLQFDQLSFWHKLAIRMVARQEKDPDRKKAMLDRIDNVKRSHLQPLLDQVQASLGDVRPQPVS